MRVMSDLLGAGAPAIRWRAHVAYEYRAPLLTDLVAALPQDEPVWVVPMYAAESAFTHALSREAVARPSRGRSTCSARSLPMRWPMRLRRTCCR